MPNRIIKDSIHTSEKLNKLTDFQFRLWVNLLTYVDDYGRGDARPAIIRGSCFPLRERLTNADINAALTALAGAGCVGLYEVDGKPYLYFLTWESHQNIRNKKSKYPAPDGHLQTIDINCKQLQANVPVIQSNPNTNPNTNTPPPKSPQGDAFADFAGENQILYEALKAFEESRKKNRKPMTDRAKELLVGELVKAPQEDWITMLENATLHGWQSVYPLKPEEKKPEQPKEHIVSYGQMSADRFKRLREREAGT